MRANGVADLPGDSALTPSPRSGSNFKVVIRVRPPLQRELHGEQPFRAVVLCESEHRRITISDNVAAILDGDDSAMAAYNSHSFTFDQVYSEADGQELVYDTTAKGVVENALLGYNATIFAYGQTGTGKTYTMEGMHISGAGQNGQPAGEARGIIPRAIEQIFDHISAHVSPRMRFLVRASYLQIYNESISDLLKPERTNLTIREAKRRGVFVEGLSEWVVRSPAEIYGLMEKGGQVRATGSTKMNELSSRSHAVFVIITEQSETTYIDFDGREITAEQFSVLVQSPRCARLTQAQLEERVRQSFRVGKLNLVDLAGSERVRISGATGQRLEETKKINQSLSALGNVISALTDKRGRAHVPYRDSKLTRILEDSLGGNCKTTMMAMVSPSSDAIHESLSTLKFAHRAKSIKNEARINEDLDQKSLLRKYERELKRLRAELQERNRNVVDKRRLLELDEQRRRAEEDKMAAIRALEARSLEFMREKEAKRKLEERIAMLSQQMVTGQPGTGPADETAMSAGGGAADGPGTTQQLMRMNALKAQQDQMRAVYEGKLADLERERETIEQEKAQVDRYKQLLLKQRDIMIALTQRLNERDEQIMALQDELDAYDAHQKELEEKLDEKTAQLIHLQRVALEHQAKSPVKSEALVQALGAWGQEQLAAQAGARPTATAPAAEPPHKSTHDKKQLLAHPQFRTYVAPTEQARQALERACRSSSDVDPQQDVLLAAAVATSAAASHESDAGGENGGGGELLTATEKITELEAVAGAHATEIGRLETELSELRAEKVSMEYLMREKLEKLVQDEIEGRMKRQQSQVGGSEGGAAAAAQQLQQELAERTAELRRVKRAHAMQVEQLRQQTGGAAAAVELRQARAETEAFRLDTGKQIARKDAALRQMDAQLRAAQAQLQVAQAQVQDRASGTAPDAPALRARCAKLVSERQAVQTIMEHKIRKLVNAVSQAGFASFDTAEAGITGSQQHAFAAKMFKREVSALKNLVEQSISALRAAAEQGEGDKADEAKRPTSQQARDAQGQGRARRLQPAQSHQQLRSHSSTGAARSRPQAPPAPASSGNLPLAHINNGLPARQPSAVEQMIHQRKAELQGRVNSGAPGLNGGRRL